MQALQAEHGEDGKEYQTPDCSRQSFCLFCPATLEERYNVQLSIHHVPRPPPAAVTGTLSKILGRLETLLQSSEI